MRKVVFGVLLALVIMLTVKYCDDRTADKIVLKEHSALIQEQIKNVGKLVVTEGHFSEVFSYKNSKALFGNLFEVEKKALVVVNADVTVAYDLSKIEYEIDEATKTLRIISVPKKEVKISPDFEYYDVQADFLNQFKAKDYNNIKDTVKKSLMKKIEKSELMSNAENRLISELSKFYILTNSLGWTLEYNKHRIENLNAIENLPEIKD